MPPPRRVLDAVAPPLAEAVIRATWASCRVDWIRPEILERVGRSGFILAFWHCKLIVMQHALRGRPVTALISQHGDGELIARTMARFGHGAARGSSTRGGARALREAIRVARAGGSLAVTPDGPRGPARRAKAGVIEMARATGLPILPVSLASSRTKRLRSWDAFELPLPFSRLAVAYGEPLACPRDADEEARELLRGELERRLDALSAECSAAVGDADPAGSARVAGSSARPTRVLLLAGEPSGDRLAAAVAAELSAQRPGVEIVAMGGRQVEAAGAALVVDSTSLGVVGLTEVVGHLGDFLRARAALRDEIERRPPDVVVPIDFPDFNLRIASFARSRGIPVAWLVGPQVWAWRPGRIPDFARVVSRMLVLFPFEVDTWRRAGVQVEHVGHPMAALPRLGRAESRAVLELPPEPARIVALLPGSRRKEVRAIWPTLAEAARALAKERPDLVFVVPLAPGLGTADLACAEAPKRLVVVEGRAREVVAACDVAAVASGTATLETALQGRALLACYRVGRLTMALSRGAADPAFLEAATYALPNLVLGRRVVPELYQDAFTAGAVAAELRRLLDDDGARSRLEDELGTLRDRVGAEGSAARIARAVLETAQER